MKFSVLMVTYDGECEYRLEKCLNSISKQTKRPEEVVICLDGKVRTELRSVIDTFQLILPIKLIENEKFGLAKNLNIGLSNCQHDIVIRCDSDDISLPDRFQVQTNILADNPSIAITSCNSIEITETTQRLKRVPIGEVGRCSISTFFKNPVNHHSCAFRKSVIEKFKYPNGEMEDFRLWVKVLGAGHLIKNTEEPLTHVSAEGLAKRRIRSGYSKAEFHLMSLNMARCKLLGIIIAPLAFCIRFPLRYNFLHKILKLALSTSRSKLAGSKNG